MQNLLDPAILFFIFGVIAGTIKSNLEIPPAISRFLSLYLLMALGLKGGFALSSSGFTYEIGISLAIAMLMAILVPLMGYLFLKNFVAGFDALAIAATYGSVSAVTFVTAVQYLDNHQIPYGGHMAAAMALMESPAIILAVVLANQLRNKNQKNVCIVNPVTTSHSDQLGNHSDTWISQTPNQSHSHFHSHSIPREHDATKTSHVFSIQKVLHESFTDGAQLLLLGAMLIGLLTGEAGKAAMQPFSVDLFKGMLSFFLLDMGLMAARNRPPINQKSFILLLYAVIGPVLHASIAVALCHGLGVSAGNTALLMVLAASASYIAVPAVLRYALPEANPSLYFGLSLGVTFPLNLVIGIPCYVYVANLLIG